MSFELKSAEPLKQIDVLKQPDVTKDLANEPPVEETIDQQFNQPFNPDNFRRTGHSEQIKQIDAAVSRLNDLSNDKEAGVADLELEKAGGRYGLKNSASFFDRAKLAIAEKMGTKRMYEESIATTAERMAHQNLDDLEKGLGRETIKIKGEMSAHEKTSGNELEILRNLPGGDQAFLKTMEDKVSLEHAALEAVKNEKEALIKEKIGAYPAFEKKREMDSLVSEYGLLSRTVGEKRKELAHRIEIYEFSIGKVSKDYESSREIKERLKDQIKTLKTQFKEISAKEEQVNKRYGELKASKKELDDFVGRLEKVGKTPTEIAAQEKQKKDNPAAYQRAQMENRPQASNRKAESPAENKVEPEKAAVAENSPAEKPSVEKTEEIPADTNENSDTEKGAAEIKEPINKTLKQWSGQMANILKDYKLDARTFNRFLTKNTNNDNIDQEEMTKILGNFLLFKGKFKDEVESRTAASAYLNNIAWPKVGEPNSRQSAESEPLTAEPIVEEAAPVVAPEKQYTPSPLGKAARENAPQVESDDEDTDNPLWETIKPIKKWSDQATRAFKANKINAKGFNEYLSQRTGQTEMTAKDAAEVLGDFLLLNKKVKTAEKAQEMAKKFIKQSL